MVSTFTTGKLALEEPATGDYANTWATPLNNNFTAIDAGLSGTTTVTMTASNVTLTSAQSQSMRINIIGALTANVTLTIPGTGFYVVQNTTTGNHTVLIAYGGGGTSVFSYQGGSICIFIGPAGVVAADDGPYIAKSGGTMTGGLALPANGLSVGGNQLYFSGTDMYSAYNIHATAFYGNLVTPSDRRLKYDIGPIVGALPMVEALQGVYYKNTKDGDQNIGLIAQDVQEVLPFVVRPSRYGEVDYGYLGVEYGKLVALLIEAIKELSGKVKALEGANDG